MAKLKYQDKIILEEVLGMSSGYVLDFTNKTFQTFIKDCLEFNVKEKYNDDNVKKILDINYDTISKANIIRAIFKNESNHNVIKLLNEINDIYFSDQVLRVKEINELDPYYAIKYKENAEYFKIQQIIDYLGKQNETTSIDQNIESYENLTEFIKNAKKHLDDENYWDVITASRTILEITFKEICNRKKIEYCKKDIVKTYNNIRLYFKMDSSKKDYPKFIKNLISNSITLVQNISEARNKSSSSHAPAYKPKKHHAKFILDQSISMMDFIISISNL